MARKGVRELVAHTDPVHEAVDIVAAGDVVRPPGRIAVAAVVGAVVGVDSAVDSSAAGVDTVVAAVVAARSRLPPGLQEP